ncbi:hypothetical protein F4780DRAFT_782520 [Xylariomycetidae sp. FL0641]|nr:hypothetical protein F4780DRAFT_782520 [Xylariomycetidae sp. FL0641]
MTGSDPPSTGCQQPRTRQRLHKPLPALEVQDINDGIGNVTSRLRLSENTVIDFGESIASLQPGLLARIQLAYDLDDAAEACESEVTTPCDPNAWEVDQTLFGRGWFVVDAMIPPRRSRRLCFSVRTANLLALVVCWTLGSQPRSSSNGRKREIKDSGRGNAELPSVH